MFQAIGHVYGMQVGGFHWNTLKFSCWYVVYGAFSCSSASSLLSEEPVTLWRTKDASRVSLLPCARHFEELE